MKKLFFLVIVCIFAMTNVWAGTRPEATGGRELYNLDIYTQQNGTYTYVVGIAFAETLNEKHPFIRAMSVESMGSGPNELMMYEADDHKRRHTIFFGSGDQSWRGTGVFEGRQNTRSKLAICFGLVANVLMTNNPDITRMEDYSNRALAIRQGTAGINPFLQALIESRTQNARLERLDFQAAYEGTLSGALGGFFGSFFSRATDLREWSGNPVTVEFLSRTRHAGFIDLPIDVATALRNTPGGPFENSFQVVVPLPARALDPRQTAPVTASMAGSHFMADQDFPDDILIEVMKTVAENSEMLATFHPQTAFITPQTMAIYTWPTEFHTGSVKFFDSVGVRPVFLGDIAAQAARAVR